MTTDCQGPDTASDAAPSFLPSPPTGNRIGVSFSGGGIRSAAFSLGSYQRLQAEGIFQRTSFLTGVSGGGYLAAALAITHACSDIEAISDDQPCWVRGGPEEAELRKNLSYLASGLAGRIWLAANLLYGLTLNLTPILLGSFVAGRLAGYGLARIAPGLDTPDPNWRILWASGFVAALLVVAMLLAVGRMRFVDRDSDSRQGFTEATIKQETRVYRMFLVMIGVLAWGAVLPVSIHLQAQHLRPLAERVLRVGALGEPLNRFLLGASLIVLAAMVGAFMVLALRVGRLQSVAGWVAALSGASLLIVPFALAAETGATRDVSWERDLLSIVVPVVVMMVFAVFVHSRRYSMHLFYRERLQSAFAKRRVVQADGSYRVEPIPYSTSILLSDVADANEEKRLAGHHFPSLVMCGAMAAADREVPTKRFATSFTFDGTWTGNPDDERSQEATTTAEDGDWIGGGQLTLPSIMAISGAALSPVMGRFTLPAYRFLMALLNLRLGVWVRRPGQAPIEEIGGARPSVKWLCRYVIRGWLEPGALFVMREALGLVDGKRRFVYVSDGGHWENLGLVELLRRRCTHIIVVDASGGSDLADFGRAMALARSELGVEITLDLSTPVDGEDNRLESPVLFGKIDYPSVNGVGPQSGELYLARSILWPDAPADLRQLGKRDQSFPHHPTSNQFLDAELFDGYRSLGWAVGGELKKIVRFPNPNEDELVLAGAEVAHDLRPDDELLNVTVESPDSPALS